MISELTFGMVYNGARCREDGSMRRRVLSEEMDTMPSATGSISYTYTPDGCAMVKEALASNIYMVADFNSTSG